MVDWLRAGFAGWRYAFSASYRRQMRERWKHKSWPYIAWDVVCGLAGVAFTMLIVYVIISSFAGWDWIQNAFA